MKNKIPKEYLAGILDGEGYIGISSRKMSGRRNYVERVTIVLNIPQKVTVTMNKFVRKFLKSCQTNNLK